jgi:hypothetical protein
MRSTPFILASDNNLRNCSIVKHIVDAHNLYIQIKMKAWNLKIGPNI